VAHLRKSLARSAAGGYHVLVLEDSALEALREQIDGIDRRILELVADRMRLVLQVGDYKREHALAVYDPERERRVLESLARSAPEPLNAESVKRIFERLIDVSRYLEQHHIGSSSE
jgi:chorismate mutase